VAIQRLEVQYGRFFTESESNSGTAVIVLGYEIAQGLFENSDPLGKIVRLFGKRFQVIGVTKKKGQNFSMGDSDDTSVFISSNFIRREFGEHNDTMLPVIVVKPEKGADMAEIKAEISYKLRNFRGVKPDEIDNFFLNVLSGFTDFIDNIVGQLNMVGWIISGFSLLVGGFGIANIMFVSVKERTNLIGIQKSLGAKNKFILFQFLFEAIILAIIGGLIGLFLVWIIALTLTNMLDFEFILSFSNVLLGTSLSAIIGLLSGILPAISAARLDPVEAIRTGI
jgi:putative ABC transport system permease protein